MRVVIVYGKPLSGKTTYIKQHKTDNDIVLDYDYLCHAITLDGMYIKPNSYIREMLNELTQTILIELLDADCVVYMPIASKSKLEYYVMICKQYGIRYHINHIEISVEDNLKRLEQCTDNRQYQEDLKGLIENDID